MQSRRIASFRLHHQPLRVLLVSTWRSHAVAAGVATYARQAGWHLDVTSHVSGEWPSRWDGDGILAVIGHNPVLRRLVAGSRCPCISLSADCCGLPLPYVDVDNVQVGIMAADHALSRHFRHFLFYSHTNWPVEHLRGGSFMRRLAETGHSADWLRWSQVRGHRRDTWDNRVRWLAQALRVAAKPLIALAIDDLRAVELIEAGLRAGLRIPEEVAVIGVGDHDLLASCAPVPLSSIAMDGEAIGLQSAHLLDGFMKNGKPAKDHILIPPVRVVSRRSTETIAATHPAVAQAVAFMLEHHQENIAAEDIIAAAGLSFTALYQAFAQEFGESPVRFLARIRLDHATRLLADPSQPLTSIARECGFRSPVNLFRTFRRLAGCSPAEHRRRLRGTLEESISR